MFNLTDDEGLDPSAPNESEQRRLALQNILDAWDEALAEGVSADILATTAIFAALSDMVEAYGEEAVAEMANGLADRVRIELRDFGVFEVKKTKAKPKARNPRTNETVFIPSRRKTHFKPSKKLKKLVKALG